MRRDIILVTGAAGFIGSNLCDRLLKDGYWVVGVDNFNNYYDPRVKGRNLDKAKKSNHFKLYSFDIIDFQKLREVFQKEIPVKVIHLAARAGVRPSIRNPFIYTLDNVLGTVNLLKLSVDFKVKQFIFGSSSSVYGNSNRLPFLENDGCTAIISPYGASKRAGEFWAESYHKTFGLKTVILRFFTVYGPRGRPDMAPALFAKAILEGKTINQFGDGSSSRDYTYVADVIDAIMAVLKKNLEFEIINLGNSRPVTLSEFIKLLETVIGRSAKIQKMPKRLGDVEKTWANVSKAKKLLDWEPKVKLLEGLKYYRDDLQRSTF